MESTPADTTYISHTQTHTHTYTHTHTQTDTDTPQQVKWQNSQKKVEEYNSLQLEGCASNNILWSLMLLIASSLGSHKHFSPLASHFQEACHFLFHLSFFIYRIGFPFLLFVAFLLEADSCLSVTAAATCCEMNSLEYGQKFLIAKVRLLTLTQTWKRINDEKSRR